MTRSSLFHALLSPRQAIEGFRSQSTPVATSSLLSCRQCFSLWPSPGECCFGLHRLGHRGIVRLVLRRSCQGPSKLFLSNTKGVLICTPQCMYPDAALDLAINTGLMDYIWVQFYNNRPCDYSGESSSVIAAWDKWSSSIPMFPSSSWASQHPWRSIIWVHSTEKSDKGDSICDYGIVQLRRGDAVEQKPKPGQASEL